MRYLRTEKLRSFHLRPFIVATDPTAVPNSVHIGEREENNTSGRAGVNLTVSVVYHC